MMDKQEPKLDRATTTSMADQRIDQYSIQEIVRSIDGLLPRWQGRALEAYTSWYQ